MPDHKKEKSWSLTRARMFHECPRRFYFQYHYAKSGYSFDAPEDAQLALEMSRIKGMDMWVGEIVHQTIQWSLEQSKSGQIPSTSESHNYARTLMSDGWRSSLKQLWRTGDHDTHPNLFEHYYKMPVGTAITDRLRNKANKCIDNYMSSDLFRWIITRPAAQWLPIDKYASFRLDGLLFYVKFDFAIRDRQTLTVFDWKTGKPSADELRQLTCYALYTSQKWIIPIENVKVASVHLQPDMIVDEHVVEEYDIEDMRGYARQSFNSMLKCLRDPQKDIAARDDFPMTGNFLRCARCNFRGICEQGISYNAKDDESFPDEEWE